MSFPYPKVKDFWGRIESAGLTMICTCIWIHWTESLQLICTIGACLWTLGVVVSNCQSKKSQMIPS
jgi:hypothetical protein